ncbi:2-oxo-3-hexenedioate decarboxylase [Aneurinibacillus migulanus]|uniref:2-oxo-3-hexenedioate decarboxylase n=2 Tax=Aneurinibacillus migulanus TaxID=47500 RepID=A0A1G8QUU0_ANEMI|nr:2-oxo-3-hexenedioate decarboxylase [Aneurinibacillus migulanus]
MSLLNWLKERRLPMQIAEKKTIAQYLLDAERERREVVRVTVDYPELNVENAYAVQEELVRMKCEENLSIVGLKIGLTSRAKMEQMGVEEPIYGYLFNNMLLENYGELSFGTCIHPKVEAEIAFILDKDIEGPGVTGAQVLAATEYVVPALEIIDSRYENFRFTLPDVIADNASASRVVFGNSLTRPDRIDLDLVGMVLNINGKAREMAAGAAVLGHPAHAIAALANMLGRKGETLKTGQIILAGAVTEAVRIDIGDIVQAKMDGLGDVGFTVVD